MKSKGLKIFSVLLLLTIIVGLFEGLGINANDAPSTLEFVYQKEFEYPFKESGRDVFYRQATLGGNTAYCIDYGRALPKNDTKTGYATSLSWQYYMSGEALAVLVYGYPNNQSAEFNIEADYGKDAAYLVTQVAFWEVMKRTGESNAKYNIDINKIVANSGYESAVEAIKSKSSALADLAMNNPYNVTPTVYIDTSAYNLVDRNDKKVAGPYKIVGKDGTNITNFTVTNVSVSLTGAPSSAVVVDSSGNPKTSFALGEEIYVEANKSDTDANFTLSANVSGNFLKCSAYGVGSTNTQKFATITTQPISIAPYVNVSWSKDTGNIVLVKEDQENKKIADVVFEVRDSSDQKVAEVTTDSEGKINLNNLPTGSYTIKEISAPSGYVMDTTSRKVVVASGSTNIETYSNTKKTGVLRITKVDQDGDPIKGIEFTIYDANGNKVQSIVTDAKGFAESKTLDVGTYTYTETGDVPDEIEADRNKYTFKIENYNDIVVRTITNNRIIQTSENGKLKVIKKDQNGKAIEGVRFTVYDQNGKKVENMYTDEDGIAISDNLPLGKYTFKEIAVPTDIIKSDEEYDFSITYDGETVEKKITNERKVSTKGSLIINKIDQYKNPIFEAEFVLYDSNGKKVEKFKTEIEGDARVDDLPNGHYVLEEVSVPNDVVLNSNKIEFDITDDVKVVTKNIENTRKVQNPDYGILKIVKKDDEGNYLKGIKFEIYDINNKKVDTITTNENGEAKTKELEVGTYYYKELEGGNSNLRVISDLKPVRILKDSVVTENVINQYKKGGIKILKVDQSKNPIAGVTFNIYDENKNEIDKLVTDSNGVTNTSKELKLGTYYYKEVSGPANVEIDTKMYKFTVENDGQIVEFNVVNNIIQGKLKISKTDVKNNPIAGVKFDILNSDKQVIQTITTDENGFAITDTLSKGKYYYKETKTLDQYVLDETEHEFNIDSETDFVEAKVSNKLKAAKLIINKFSKEDNTPLKDIRFEIIDSNNNIIQSIVTDENGRAQSDDLNYGKYYYKEVSSPDNYVLDSSMYEFEIKDNGVNVEKNVYNVKKKLPVTGSIFSTNVIIVIIVTISCSVLYVIIKMIIAYNENKNNRW